LRSCRELYHRRFLILAKHFPENIHDFLQGGVGFDRFKDGGHQVSCAPGGLAQIGQAAGYGLLVAGGSDLFEAGALNFVALGVHGQNGDLQRFIHHVIVDADDGALVGVNFTLVAAGGVGDFFLKKAGFNGR
jgi:hypothetical protein